MNIERMTRSEAVDTLLQNHPSYEGAKNVANLCNFDVVSTLAVMEGYNPTLQYAKEDHGKNKFDYYKVEKINILNGYADLIRVDVKTCSRNLCWIEPSTEEEFYSALAEYEASKEQEA